MIATFTIVGSVVAFATAAFTLWDRLARGRPIAFFGTEGPTSDPRSYIQVKNASEIDIMILGFRCRPTRFMVAKGSSVREIAGALIGTPGTAVLEPKDQWHFQLIKGPHGPEPTGRIWVRMSWRKSTCTWLPQMPVWLSTTKRDLDRIAGGTE
jgi:hypothetical protein